MSAQKGKPRTGKSPPPRKRCSRCGVRKRHECFDRVPANHDGLHGKCKNCRAQVNKHQAMEAKPVRTEAELELIAAARWAYMTGRLT